jgi:hypothetical protein
LHLAQVIQMALKEGPNGPATARPEERYSEQPQTLREPAGASMARAGGLLAGIGSAGALAWHASRGHS